MKKKIYFIIAILLMTIMLSSLKIKANSLANLYVVFNKLSFKNDEIVDSRLLCDNQVLEYVKYNVNIIAIVSGGETLIMPSAEYEFQKGDHIKALGKKECIDKIVKEIH